jgi:uncharacterized membrane protein
MITLQVIAAVLTSIAMALSLAHALELPGKLRLNRGEYFTVQKIYYPGFTLGGLGEGLALVLLIVLTAVTPRESPSFKWTLASLAALLAMHVIYWTVTHPVNKIWVRDSRLSQVGARFFGLGAETEPDNSLSEDQWTRYRDRWERSHAVRAVLSMAAFIFLLIAIAP